MKNLIVAQTLQLDKLIDGLGFIDRAAKQIALAASKTDDANLRRYLETKSAYINVLCGELTYIVNYTETETKE